MNDATPTPLPEPPSRGDSTRDALVRAAIHVFGENGFAAASTRAIAEAAGANQALIGYHFGGKDGLYMAAINQIADEILNLIGAVDAHVRSVIDAEATQQLPPPERRALLLSLVHAMLDGQVGVMTNPASAAWAKLILREQQQPGPGFERLYAAVMQPMIGTLTRLVAALRASRGNTDAPAAAIPADAAPTSDDTLLAMSLIGPALMFRAARAAVLRGMGWTDIGPEEVARLRARLRANATAVLMPDSPETRPMHPREDTP